MGHICGIKENEIWRIIAIAVVVMAAVAFAIATQSDGSDGVQSGKCGNDLPLARDPALADLCGHITVIYKIGNHRQALVRIKSRTHCKCHSRGESARSDFVIKPSCGKEFGKESAKLCPSAFGLCKNEY